MGKKIFQCLIFENLKKNLVANFFILKSDFCQNYFFLNQILFFLKLKVFEGKQSSFESWEKNLVSVCILFWLVFSHNLPKIPLVAYHSIQKIKFYLLGQKIKSSNPLLIIWKRIFERVPISQCIHSHLIISNEKRK